MNENIVDKRVYKTLTKIENGMIRLLEDKPYKDINVKDICRESGISRGTFYQHYTNKDDFLYQYQKEHIERMQFFEYALNFWIHEGELLLLLLKDESAYIVHQAIKKNFQQNIEIRLVPIVNTNSLTNKEKYLLIIFMSNAIFGVLQDWAQRGRPESPKELTLIINNIFKTVWI